MILKCLPFSNINISNSNVKKFTGIWTSLVCDQIFWGNPSCFRRFDCVTNQVHNPANFLNCWSFLKNTFTFSGMRIKVGIKVIANPYIIYQYMYYNWYFINTSILINQLTEYFRAFANGFSLAGLNVLTTGQPLMHCVLSDLFTLNSTSNTTGSNRPLMLSCNINVTD